MKGITIKLPETTLRRLRQQARDAGRSVAALVRERVEGASESRVQSVYNATADLAGSLIGRRRAASNERRRFRRR
jgi:predicted DNA-binding protein